MRHALAIVALCSSTSSCAPLLGNPFEVTSGVSESDAGERPVSDAPDAAAGDAGSETFSVRIERSPSFAPFDVAPYFSRTDPQTGEAVTATVRVRGEARFDLREPPQLI